MTNEGDENETMKQTRNTREIRKTETTKNNGMKIGERYVGRRFPSLSGISGNALIRFSSSPTTRSMTISPRGELIQV